MLSFYTVHRFALSLSLKMHRVCFGSCCRVWRCVLKQMPPDILKIAYKQLQVVSQYAFLMILANQPPNYSCRLSLLKAWCYLVVRCIARHLDIFGTKYRTKTWNIIRIDLKHSQIQVLPNLTSQLRTVHPFKAFSCHVSKRLQGRALLVIPCGLLQSLRARPSTLGHTHKTACNINERWWNICINWEKVISCHYANGCSCSCYLHKELMKIQMPFDVSDSQLKNITFGTAEGSCIDPRDPWHRPRRILSLEVARCGARPTFIDFTRFLHSRSFSLHSNRRYFLQKKCEDVAAERKDASLNSRIQLVLMESNMTRPKSSLTVFLVSWAVQRLGSMICWCGDPAPPYNHMKYHSV